MPHTSQEAHMGIRPLWFVVDDGIHQSYHLPAFLHFSFSSNADQLDSEATLQQLLTGLPSLLAHTPGLGLGLILIWLALALPTMDTLGCTSCSKNSSWPGGRYLALTCLTQANRDPSPVCQAIYQMASGWCVGPCLLLG